MAHYLICCTPARSHVGPMLAIAGHLSRQGHDVLVLTGSRFRDQVERTGAGFAALPPECDYDDADLDRSFPGREKLHGLDRFRFDIDHIFVDPIPAQAEAVGTLIVAHHPDAVVVDVGFVGVVPLLLRGPTGRPPVVTIGLTPLMFSSRDTAPFGLAKPPSASPLGRLRNRALQELTHRMFRGNQRHINEVLERLGLGKLPVFFLDVAPLADQYLQLCGPSFEYPRSDLPAHVRFVGPIIPPPTTDSELPPWWDEVEDGRPVVLVTQGTVDNLDLSRLLEPTLSALDGADVLVIATTGGRPVSVLPPPPDNARVVEFIPYAAVLPHADLMVTNGGYGGVQQSLAYGVPLIVAGDSEDKPEVAARVAWTRTGIDLRTGQPEPRAIREAVDRVLTDPTYRARATQLAAEMRGLDALTSIEESLRTVRPRQGTSA
nr:nucleotide disphospho-sugar-binding domain-containing protein [uncultured Friedmanniella sp.]